MKFCDTCGAVYICVPGEPISKANNRRLFRNGGKPIFVKSPKALSLEAHWRSLCPSLPHLITDDVAIHARLYYASRRPDLDESLVLDLLQGKLIANDRQVKEKHIYWSLDKLSPRSEVIIKTLGVDCDESCLTGLVKD